MCRGAVQSWPSASLVRIVFNDAHQSSQAKSPKNVRPREPSLEATVELPFGGNGNLSSTKYEIAERHQTTQPPHLLTNVLVSFSAKPNILWG
jgi:hypothetical protein